MPLLEFLDRCIDPFCFHSPFVDLLILLQPSPKLRCFIEQVNGCADLLLYLLQLRCCFLFPFLLHYWWHGWYELLPEILNLLLVLFDCLRNLINLFHYCKFIPLCDVWKLLKNSFYSLFQFVPMFSFLLSFRLGLLTDFFQRLPLLCCSL
jgi:hypothetical protein